MRAFSIAALSLAIVAQTYRVPPRELPPQAVNQLTRSLEAARPHRTHVWRDTPAVNPDGTLNGYVEIPRGERQKWEFDMKANARSLDRVIPPEVGGYPVNYGFVPQTISYDGDPFDVLVLGPALAGGEIVRGVIVGAMFMEDEKGLDSKVVTSAIDADGRPRYALSEAEKKRIGDYFAKYKKHEPGKFSRVTGWGSADDGRAHVRMTSSFFHECAKASDRCIIR